MGGNLIVFYFVCSSLLENFLNRLAEIIQKSGQMASSISPGEQQGAQAHWYEKLMRFYEHYAPDKVPTAAITLKAYEGREELMFRSLEKKYGPLAAVPFQSGKESRTPRKVVSETPSQDVGTLKSRGLVQQQTPPSILAPPRGLSSLAAVAVEVNPPTVPSLPQLHYDVYRVRLERFYTQYAPEKLSVVDTALEAYAGREEAMFKLLEKKYGPEPKAFVVVSPVTRKYHADDDDEEEDQSGGSPVRQRAADEHVNPQSLRDPVPYDYFEALINAGFQEANIEEALTAFGSGKEHYAAAVCLILTIVGHDALFDTNTPLQFPVSKLRFVKKCEPDIVDQVAFEHVCTYKKVFVAAVEHAAHLRQMEALERSAILKELKLSMGQLSYRMVVLAEALRYIGPIEEERRVIVGDDERLRREGLTMWFRQRRQEIVDKIDERNGRFRSISFHARSGEEEDDNEGGEDEDEKDLDELEQRFKALHARQKQESDAIKEKWCSRANYCQRTEARSPSASAKRNVARSTEHIEETSRDYHAGDGAGGPARPRWQPTGSASPALRSVSMKSAATTSSRTASKSIPASSVSHSADVVREAEHVIGSDRGCNQQQQQQFNLFASARAKYVARRGAFSSMMGIH